MAQLHQFGIRFVGLAVVVMSAAMASARLVAGPAVVAVACFFFAFWFSLSYFLLTRSTRRDGGRRAGGDSRLSIRWRLIVAALAGLVVFVLVLLTARETNSKAPHSQPKVREQAFDEEK